MKKDKMQLEPVEHSGGGRGFGGKLLAVLLGFVLGVTGTIGGVAGAGYWVVTRPIEKVENLAQNAVPNLDLSKYLTEQYYKGTVLDLIGGISDAISEISAGESGFAALAKISPTVETAVRDLAKKINEFGSNIPQEDIYTNLMKLPFQDLGGYLSGTLVQSIEIGPMLLGAKAFDFQTLTQDNLMMAFLYGSEGTDYQIVTEKDENNNTVQKIVPIEGGRAPLSVGEIQQKGFDPLLEYIAVDALLNVEEGDAMMCALAYGSSSHYEFVDTEEKDELGDPIRKVQMKQRLYTFDGTNFYDENANLLDCKVTSVQGVAGAYKLAFEDENGNVVDEQYALKKAAAIAPLSASQTPEVNEYCIYTDAEMKKPLTFKKTTFADLMNDPEDVLNTIELASLMDLDGDSNPILIALAYGVEGEDYEIEEVGDGKGGVQKNIVPKNGKTPKTIGDLMGDGMEDTINNLALDSMMEVDLTDGMMCSIAYGPKSHYMITETTENGVLSRSVTMNQVEYTNKAGKWKDIDGNVLNASLVGNELTITRTEEKDGTSTTTVETVKVVYNLEKDRYFQVDEENKPVLYEKTTVGSLQENPAELIDNIELGQVLNVHPENPDDDKLMVALAYGNKGEHYDFNADGTIYFLGDNKPRTIADLRSNEDLFKTIYIGDALNVNENSHPVLIALAYGEEGVDFEWRVKKDKNGDPVVVDGKQAQEPFMLNGKPRTIQEMEGEGSNDLINSITLESALGVSASSDAMMRALAYGQEGVHYEAIEYQKVNGALVPTAEKVTMKQAVYNPVYDTENPSKIVAFTNRFNEQVHTGVAVLNGDYYEILTHDEVKQYVHKTSHLVFEKEGEELKAVPFKKATLGDLSNNSSEIMNDITLADALDVKRDDPDRFKRAIAFAEDGTAYTIGDFSEDPLGIVNTIPMDTIMDLDEDDAMTMYLLYGKKGVHYQISELTPLQDIPKDATIVGTPTETHAKYVVMLDKVMTVHQKLDHETGEPVFDGEKPVMCVHNEYGESLGDKADGTQENHPVVKPVATNDEITIGSVKYNAKYTYTIPNDSAYVYRLLLPQDSTLYPQIRVKGYYTYDHYEPAYLLQVAKQDGNGNATSAWETQKYKPNTIASLTEADTMSHLTQRLTLEEVLNEDLDKGNPLLKPIAHTTIDELPGAINSLTITEVFETDVYKTIKVGTEKQVVNASNTPIYYDRETKKWFTTQNFVAGTESEPVLVSTWKYLLKDTTPEFVAAADGDYVKVDENYVLADGSTPPSAQRYKAVYTAANEYKVTQTGELVHNMTSNIQSATLSELYQDEILALTNADILGKPIKYSFLGGAKTIAEIKDENGNTKVQFGELTITEMISYMSAILSLEL